VVEVVTVVLFKNILGVEIREGGRWRGHRWPPQPKIIF